MRKVLRLHTRPWLNDLEVNVGDEFEVVEEDETLYAIEVGDYTLAFTKEADESGLSYRNWFDLKEE